MTSGGINLQPEGQPPEDKHLNCKSLFGYNLGELSRRDCECIYIYGQFRPTPPQEWSAIEIRLEAFQVPMVRLSSHPASPGNE